MEGGKKHDLSETETKEMVLDAGFVQPKAVSNEEDAEKENGFFAPDINSFGNSFR